jgi:hypothetical protein
MSCLFCNNQLETQMYRAECPNCELIIVYRPTGHTLDSPWRVQWYTIKLQDEIYQCLTIDLEKKCTTIYIYEPKGHPNFHRHITIPKLFPEINPSNALAYTRRLHNLIAFT